MNRAVAGVRDRSFLSRPIPFFMRPFDVRETLSVLSGEFTRSALCRRSLSIVTRPGLALTTTEACSKAHIPAKQTAAVVFPIMMP